MNFNPFTIRFGYHATRALARKKRMRFMQRLSHLPAPSDVLQRDTVDLDVVCMLGTGSLPEAVFALQTLLAQMGRPSRLVLVSDGSLDDQHSALLRRLLPGSEVLTLQDVLEPELPQPIKERVAEHWMVAKQAILMSFPKERPCLFVDSDVLFFAGAQEFSRDLLAWGDTPAFMVDVSPHFDVRLLRNGESELAPLNSGFLYMPRPLDWRDATARFAELPIDAPLTFTDQTMSHIAFHQAGAVAMDSHRFVLTTDDQFDARDRYAGGKQVVCRHYVNTIRHKMWMQWGRV